MRSPLCLLLVALVLAPAAAQSADVPVTYTVDSTALKLAVSGTNLTFELFSDAACTVATHNQVLTVDNVSMLSALKRSKPKSGTKPPKTTDIRATLTGVGPTSPIYLAVTGTGITAVGGACQVQASTTAGLGGASLVVRDSNGNLLGPLDASGNLVISDGGVAVVGYVPPTGFNQFSNFYYASVDCTGPRLSLPAPGLGGYGASFNGADGNTLYYGPVTAPSTAYASSDYAPEIPGNCTAPGQTFNLPDRCCCTGPVCTAPGVAPLAPASTIDISVFVPPFYASME